MTNPSYPPLDTLKPVAPDLWIVDSILHHGLGPTLPIRMTVARLPGGALWLHSPTPCTVPLRAELNRLGPVRHLVAPNIAHWTLLREWQSAYPDALTWSAPGLRERRQVRRSGLRLDRDLGNTPPESWGDAFEQVVVPGGLGFHEVAFHHRPSRTVILTDLVLNLEPQKLPWAERLALRLAGATAPDGRAPIYLRAVVRAGGAPARRAAAHILSWSPERVLFTHGLPFERDATAQLRRSLRWLLPVPGR
ncbi:DUF4336 domain-containing protein [Roseomonas sp. BN140053]|uniref:DUF4336 domain-containing protein n=1 Tax=Roseomonas sp. BN140053 TaxID=3391898 RepID=UPI0039EBBBF5